MSDNRAHEWLDGEAAESLLSGGRDDPRAEALTRLLSAAAAPAPVDPAREEMAVAAFRAARDEIRNPSPARGARSGHDWRRGGGRLRVGRSVRALTGALVATAALGGVAVAAATGTLPGALSLFNGPAAVSSPSPVADPTPSAGASDRSDDESPAGGTTRGVPSPAPSPSLTDAGAGSAKGAAARRDEALCLAWAQAGHRKQGTDHKAFEQLVAEAGGRGKVHKYCADVLGWNGKHNKNGNTNNKESGREGTDGSSGGQRSGGDKGDKGDDGSDGSDGKGNRSGSGSHGNGGNSPVNGHQDRGGSGDGTGRGHRHDTRQAAHEPAAGSVA